MTAAHIDSSGGGKSLEQPRVDDIVFGWSRYWTGFVVVRKSLHLLFSHCFYCTLTDGIHSLNWQTDEFAFKILSEPSHPEQV